MIMLITMIMLIMVILLMIMMITTPTRHYTRPCKTVCFTIIGLKFFQRLCSWNGTSYNHSNKSNAYIALDVCDDILWRHKCTDIRSIDHLRTVTLPVRWDQCGFFSYHKWSSNKIIFKWMCLNTNVEVSSLMTWQQLRSGLTPYLRWSLQVSTHCQECRDLHSSCILMLLILFYRPQLTLIWWLVFNEYYPVRFCNQRKQSLF